MEDNLNNKSGMNSGTISSPLKNRELIVKVNALSSKQNFKNSYKTNPQTALSSSVITQKTFTNIDYKKLVRELSNLGEVTDIDHLYSLLHRILTKSYSCSFLAFGFYHEKSNCINLKLTDKLGNSFSSKFLISDKTNPIVDCFLNKKVVLSENTEFLKMSYFHSYTVAILPMISIGRCVGVMIVADQNAKQNYKLYSLLSSYAALVAHNADLIEKSNDHANIDNLTSLYNHRGLQDCIDENINKANTSKKDMSIIMMDINNMTKINKEFGHTKGDEVIRLVADKIKQNIRKSDIAGRYGGDEIAIILPDTEISEAKYIAEFLTYTLSCCFVDDVGPVKVSVGVGTYPKGAEDKEKLLILTEQAMHISKAKGYKDGMSAIISSADFNFWDDLDLALKSYAEILTKRQVQFGTNFEEELFRLFKTESIKSTNHLEEMAASLAGAIDAKDTYTKGHSTSVSRYSEALARAINLPEKEVERIRIGALLHDVGKIGIPESVLRKPDKLSDEEWEIMKQHPAIGAEKVLKSNDTLKDLIPIVKYHHERIDGKGYPEHLTGDKIPLAARIVAVADAYHALISDRPYRKGLGIEKACEILSAGMGTQWDSDLTRKFIQIAPSLSTTV